MLLYILELLYPVIIKVVLIFLVLNRVVKFWFIKKNVHLCIYPKELPGDVSPVPIYVII